MSLLARRKAKLAGLGGGGPSSFQPLGLDLVSEDTPLTQIMDKRREFGVPEPSKPSKTEMARILMRVENAALCDKGIALGDIMGSGRSNEVYAVKRMGKDDVARGRSFDVLMRARTLHYPPEDKDKLLKDIENGLFSVFAQEIRVTQLAAAAGCGPRVEDAWICAYRKKKEKDHTLILLITGVSLQD
mgnify:FL=1